MSLCKELITNSRLVNRSDLRSFDLLHFQGRKLIVGWFQRAWSMRHCADEDAFEPFIYTWIAFNGWAACITGLDRDRDWLDALMLDQEITDKFASLVANTQSALARIMDSFRQIWPIFKAQDLRRRGLFWHSAHSRNREQVVLQYLSARIAHEPKCWERHQNEGGSIPLDWPHTLSVLYRVRCNLFHGEKTPHSEIDKVIVSRAFRVLACFLSESRFMG
jgi:hypothetical protein